MRPSWATCCRWPASSSSSGPRAQAQTGEPHAPARPSPPTSRRSPAASRSSTSTARTIPSSGPPSTPSGATSCPRARSVPGRDELLDLTYATRSRSSRPAAASTPAAREWGCGSTGGSSTRGTSGPGTFPGSSGHHAGELAAERLLARPDRRARVITPAGCRPHIARAKQLSLSLLYWLQTECPRPDGKTGWKGLRLQARPGRHRRRPGQGPLYSRVAADPGRVHRARAARRYRGPAVGTNARERPGRDRSPTASASAATGSTCIPARAGSTTSTSARCRSRSRWVH